MSDLIYDVTKNTQKILASDGDWLIQIFEGSNIIQEFDAVTEKQGHFLAKRDFPNAMSMSKYDKLKDMDYHSSEGYAYRRNHEQ